MASKRLTDEELAIRKADRLRRWRDARAVERQVAKDTAAELLAIEQAMPGTLSEEQAADVVELKAELDDAAEREKEARAKRRRERTEANRRWRERRQLAKAEAQEREREELQRLANLHDGTSEIPPN